MDFLNSLVKSPSQNQCFQMRKRKCIEFDGIKFMGALNSSMDSLVDGLRVMNPCTGGMKLQ